MLEARREAGIWWERVGTEEEGGVSNL